MNNNTRWPKKIFQNCSFYRNLCPWSLSRLLAVFSSFQPIKANKSDWFADSVSPMKLFSLCFNKIVDWSWCHFVCLYLKAPQHSPSYFSEMVYVCGLACLHVSLSSNTAYLNDKIDETNRKGNDRLHFFCFVVSNHIAYVGFYFIVLDSVSCRPLHYYNFYLSAYFILALLLLIFFNNMRRYVLLYCTRMCAYIYIIQFKLSWEMTFGDCDSY